MRPPHVGLNRTLNLILGGAVCLLPLSSVHAAQRVDLDGPGWTFRTMLDDQAQSITNNENLPQLHRGCYLRT
jgi:hypothetical protein